MLSVALVFRQIMIRLRQPAVVGELIGGILLGPSVIGALLPGFYAWLFPADGWVSSGREAFLSIGMLFFLFTAGLEMNFGQLRSKGKAIFLTSLLGSAVPFVLGYCTVLLAPQLWGQPALERPALLALAIGTALSISALPVIARILMEIRLIDSEMGNTILASASIGDLIGWTLFSVILSSMAPGEQPRNFLLVISTVVGFAAAVLLAGHWLGPRIMRWGQSSLAWPSGFIGLVTIFMLSGAALAESLGIHAIFGAFLVGVGLNQGQTLKKDDLSREVIYQFAISFFAPLYFVSIGLKVNFLTNFDPWLVLGVILIASLGKILGASLGARLGGMTARQSWMVGLGLNARGAMEIILASAALDRHLIDQRIFVALVTMAVVTTMLSGPALQRLSKP